MRSQNCVEPYCGPGPEEVDTYCSRNFDIARFADAAPWHTLLRQEEKENIRKYMKMLADREAKAEEERMTKKAAADAAFKVVAEQTEKQNNEEDELRMLRQAVSSSGRMSPESEDCTGWLACLCRAYKFGSRATLLFD